LASPIFYFYIPYISPKPIGTLVGHLRVLGLYINLSIRGHLGDQQPPIFILGLPPYLQNW